MFDCSPDDTNVKNLGKFVIVLCTRANVILRSLYLIA